MANTVPLPPLASTEPVAAPAASQPASEPKAKTSSAAAKPAQEREPLTRLMIEEVGGRFVYTVVDRVSGRVIAQIPREEVERIGQDETYNAGAVVDTRA